MVGVNLDYDGSFNVIAVVLGGIFLSSIIGLIIGFCIVRSRRLNKRKQIYSGAIHSLQQYPPGINQSNNGYNHLLVYPPPTIQNEITPPPYAA